MSDQPHDGPIKTVYSLTSQEWSEIRSLAVKMYHSGQFGKDHFKCTIAAFMEWIVIQPDEFQFGVEMDSTLH